MNSINSMHRVWLFELSAQGARTLAPTQPATLRVLAGGLWLTRSGDAGDHFLQAGDELALGPGRTVVEPHGCALARFEVRQSLREGSAPRRGAWRWRGIRAWPLAVAP